MQTDVIFNFNAITLSLHLNSQVWAPTSFAQNMASHLAHWIQPGDRVLELGLGSGVLAILAAKLGASQVTGLDINPQAIELAKENWQRNGLAIENANFLHSDRLNALPDTEEGQFDLIFSNPPVLPVLEGVNQTQHTRDDFEIAGKDGRALLDTVLTQTGIYLKPNGQLLTIATSLQGWEETERLLNTYWRQWEICQTVVMALTEECTQPYIDYWQQQAQADGRQRIYRQEDVYLHDVWFLHAQQPYI